MSITEKPFEERGLEYNLATNTKWLCQISLDKIFTDIHGEVKLNLSSFRLPEIQLGYTEATGYLSKKIPVPTKILNPDSQEITFEYLMSSNFHQYILLYRWIQRITVEMQKNTNFVQHGDPTQYTVPINIFLLSEFKKPILKVTFNECWPQRLGELMFDYKVVGDDPITHSFTVKYNWFSIQTLTDVFGADGNATT